MVCREALNERFRPSLSKTNSTVIQIRRPVHHPLPQTFIPQHQRCWLAVFGVLFFSTQIVRLDFEEGDLNAKST
jgi:hypothetical protein